MKPVYALFILMIGVCRVCSGDEHGIPHHENVPKAPMAPVKVAKAAVNQTNVHEPTPHVENKTVPSPNSKPTPKESDPNLTAPSTTTPAPPTPTPTPPVYGVGSWNVSDEKGNVCILLKGELELVLKDELHNTTQNFKVPKNAPYTGHCSMECIEFTLPNDTSLHLMFAKNDSSFYIHAFKANLTYTILNKTETIKFSNDSLHLFETPVDSSYHCAPAAENLLFHHPAHDLIFKVSDFQVEAFMNSTSAEFGASVIDCESPHTPDIVPIIVGCALALLVILVLVAYLVSRVRSQSRGYHSM